MGFNCKMKLTVHIENKPHILIWLILFIAFMIRLQFIIYAYAEAGDTSTYETFANNILSGCGMSQSKPSSNECILSVGGYFPGYPAFIAFVWLLFGKSTNAVLLAQLTCYILALYWLLISILRMTKNFKAMFSVGIILALSPLQIGWFRFILTEPLAIATATWFAAEIIISIHQKKLRIFHLALALSCSIYIRPDAIFMAFGVILTAFYIYDFRTSFRHITIFVALASIPVSGWLIRNVLLGHEPLSMTADTAPKAPGYFHWLDTWVTNEYERSDANFPVWRSKYSEIKFHNSKYITENELVRVNILAQQLSEYDGRDFPENIDNQFKDIALNKISSRNYFTSLKIYVERLFYFIFNPFSSWGLPLEINGIDRSEFKNIIINFDLSKFIIYTSDHKIAILGKLVSLFYRIILFLLFIFVTFLSVFKLSNKCQWDFCFETRVLILATSLVVITRLSFLVFIGGLESRYMVAVITWVECCIALSIIRRRSDCLPTFRHPLLAKLG